MILEAQIKSLKSLKTVLLATFIVLSTIFFYTCFVVPHKSYLQAAQRQASTINKFAKKTRFINTNVVIKKKKLEELQEKFKDIHIKLFKAVEADEFLSDLQAMAEQTNCIIYSLHFSPTDTASKPEISKISGNITSTCATLIVAGTYKDIIAMINKLQNRSKQVWIDSIDIEQINNNSDMLKCSMSIRFYVIK